MTDATGSFTPIALATIDAMVCLFESGAPARYDAVSRSATDAGGLSYGKHQASLTGGGLYQLISQYCQASGAAHAEAFKPYLPQMQAKDRALDGNDALAALLKEAGKDPVMQNVQDAFFREHYMAPALAEVSACGFTSPLACAVVYDSKIQGSWSTGADIKGRTTAKIGAPSAANEKDWIKAYLQTRRDWLISRGADLAKSVYRVDALSALVAADAWDLELPLGVALSGFVFSLSAWDLNGSLFPDPIFRVPPEQFGTVKARHAYVAEGRDRHVQSLMAGLGLLDAKAVDGKFGVGSANAFKSFQLSCGATQTGVVDPDGYLLLCDAVQKGQGAKPEATPQLKPLPDPTPRSAGRTYTAAGASAGVAAAASLIGSQTEPPPPAPKPAALPGVAQKAAEAVSKASPSATPSAAPPATPPATPTAPQTIATTAQASPSVDVAVADAVRSALPWLAVAFLISALIFFILARRRAY